MRFCNNESVAGSFIFSRRFDSPFMGYFGGISYLCIWALVLTEKLI